MLNIQKKQSSSIDMTQGSILKHLVLFSIPLLLGNLFQIMYNTVDTLVLGNFVSTQALAAVGSTSVIVNMVVFFFNGLSIGAGVVISQNFGSKDLTQLHKSVETTMAMTFILSIFFTILGILLVSPMLAFMSTPEDVIPEASLYLRIYFSGISGLMIYNMGAGVLRAVGDSKNPLYFLIFTSIINTILDLVFVIGFHSGISGVGYATIISQFISAFLIIRMLTKTSDIYRMTWNDLRIDLCILKQILTIGLPTAIQSTITSFSNVFVQSYINSFGSFCMAGWSCYNKIEQYIFLPIQSISAAITTFVSQNMGARQKERANRGTVSALLLIVSISTVLVAFIMIFAAPATRLFTDESSVVKYGTLFLRANSVFVIANCVNHVLAGALRGRGDSRAPMIIMLLCFVLLRQIYLFTVTHYVANTPLLVGLGYPVGWSACCIVEVTYFIYRYIRHPRNEDL